MSGQAAGGASTAAGPLPGRNAAQVGGVGVGGAGECWGARGGLLGERGLVRGSQQGHGAGSRDSL
jgi:hypothetical protein